MRKTTEKMGRKLFREKREKSMQTMEALTHMDICGGEYNWHSPGKKHNTEHFRSEQKQTIGSFLYDGGAQAL